MSRSGLPSAEELAEIQAQEMEALGAILGDDFRLVPVASAWKNVQHAHDIVIDIRHPADDDDGGGENGVITSLRLHLPKTYPYAPPTISLEAPSPSRTTTRLPHDAQLELTQRLRTEAQAHLESEMVWDLVGVAQDWIASFAKRRKEASAQAEAGVSLEQEQRRRVHEAEQAELKKQEEERAANAQAEAARAEHLSRHIELTAAKHAEALRQEKRRVRLANEPQDDKVRRAGDDDDASGGGVVLSAPAQVNKDDQRFITFLDPIQDSGRSWSAVRLGPALDHGPLSITFIAEPAHQDPNMASTSTLYNPSWLLEQYTITSPYFQSSHGRKKLEDIEAEIEKLRQVHDLNLVNVHACSLARVQEVEEQQQGWRLNILLERHTGPTVADVLRQAECLPWARVQTYLLGLLAGLDALHSKNLIHRSIDPESIQLSPGAQGARVAKLRNNCYVRRMHDLHAAHPLVDAAEAAEVDEATMARPWLAPEATGSGGTATYSKRQDVWDLARCTVQMLCGLAVVEHISSPEKLLDTHADLLHPTARKLLAYMFDRSPRRRPSAEAVLARLNELLLEEDKSRSIEGSRTARLALPQSMHRQRSISDAGKHDAAPPTPGPLTTQPGSFWQLGQAAQQEPANYSRYRADFEEVKFLGKGAYGSVVKARNRLDGNFYAIKRIKLSSSAENDERTLREITALSRLSHAHIVRYVTCWIESEMPTAPNSSNERGLGGGVTSTRTTTTTTTASTTQLSKSLHDENAIGGNGGGGELELGPFGLNFGFDDDFLSRGHDAFSASYPDIQFRRDSESEEESGSSTSSEEEESDSSSSTTSGRGGRSRSRSQGRARLKRSALTNSTSPTSDSEIAPPAPSPVRWLHIQMELVDSGTLKDAIERGLSTDDAWRVFRQLLEALAHINTLGIVHRDIKPANIMVTPTGDVKLGDFGLATTTPQQLDAEEGGTADMTDSTDLTSNIVGTNLYIAPEILKGVAGRKRAADKVDMYSLGIVFFEMLASQRVYTTGMERVVVLQELRTEAIKFPAGWPGEELGMQTVILRKLLDHDEERRPTPAALLKSDLLPPKLEDDYIEECLRLMSNPTSAYHHRLLDALFTEVSHDEVREYTFDVGAEGEAHQPYLNVIVDRLQALFKRHGAVPLRTPLLMPPNDMYGADRKPVQLLDKTGRLVQLPFDHLVSFARMCARSRNKRFKRYEIGPVFRENVIAGSQPRSLLEVDVDIISPEKTRLAEAEILLILEEIIEDVPGLSAEEWVVHLNHGEVLEILLDRVPDKHRPALLGALAGLGSKRANASARSKLAKFPLPRSVLDEIEVASAPGELKAVQQRLERLIAIDHRPKLALAFQQLEEVVNLARQFGVQRPLLVSPLMTQGSSFYKGEIFFSVLKADKRRDVLAIGGRYDWLIKRFANPANSTTPPHGVGVQISAGQIAASLSRYQDRNVAKFLSRPVEEERSFGQWTPRRADVYVASGDNMRDARIEVVRSLWAHGINADLAYDHVSSESAEAIASTCRSEGILFLVHMPHPHKLKVKNILRRTEQDVSRHELCSWLATEIARQRALDVIHGGHGHTMASISSAPGVGLSDVPPSTLAGLGLPTVNTSTTSTAPPHSAGLATHLGPGQGFDFNIVLPDREKRGGQNRGDKDRERKLRGSSKQALQDKAAREAARIGEDLLYGNASVLVVDLSWPTLQRFAAACSQTEDRAFWELLAGVPEEKEYLRKLRRAVEEMGEGARTGLVRLLYSSRVDRGVILS